MPGTLYVVATPLGNLEDLPGRASRILASVAVVACEDTRRTRRLLAKIGVGTPTMSCHRFNERSRIQPVIDRLLAGDDVALVSDGGTPGISDPGSMLVRSALSEGIRVASVPGPSAIVAALSVSGCPGDRFVFEGFLPSRGGERRRRLRALAREERTVVIFEAPHRILDTLEDMASILGERAIVLCRELTKIHETVSRGTAASIRGSLGERRARGEIVLVLDATPGGAVPSGDRHASDRLAEAFARELGHTNGDRREALKRTARALGMKRSELWRRLAERGDVESEG